jgi:hypothetical protein
VVKVHVISLCFTIKSRILSVPSPTGGDQNNRPPFIRNRLNTPVKDFRFRSPRSPRQLFHRLYPRGNLNYLSVIDRYLPVAFDQLPATSLHDLDLQSMKHVESQWKPLEEEGAQVCAEKKWLLLNDKTGCPFASH